MKIVVALAQMSVCPRRTEENLAKAERLVAEAARRGSTVVCLPEMWTTGFDWAYNERALADAPRAVEAAAAMAKRYRVWLTGSMLSAAPSGKCANTAFLLSPDGAIAARYIKMHLFGLIGENEHSEAGTALGLARTPWGASALAICYDIRFPELFRSYALKGARIVFISAAFPHPRLHHWKTLLRARAIEDQFFVAAVNRVGAEDLGPAGRHTYVGNSAIIDPWGETVAEAGEAAEGLTVAEIDLGRVDSIRREMPVLQDRRSGLYDIG